MKDKIFAFVDLETTGLDPFRCEILEIGIVLARQAEDDSDLFGKRILKKVSEHEIQLKPEHIETAERKALEVSKYHTRDWSKAVAQKDGLEESAKILSGAIFIAQNMAFDWSFLIASGNTHGVNFDRSLYYHKLDLASMVLGKLYHDKKLSRFTLNEMAQYFDVKNENAHTALSDARATFDICKKLFAM